MTSDPGAVRDVELGHLGYFAAFGRLESPEGTFPREVRTCVSGVKLGLFNIVYAVGSSTSPSAIRSVVDRFDALGLPYLWWLLPSNDRRTLGRELEAAGFVLWEESIGMAADLAALQEPGAPVPELEIREARSARDATEFARTFVRGSFEVGREVSRAVEGLFTSLRESPDVALFVGTLRGRPVGTSLGFYRGGVIGVHAVATLPRFRRRGIGVAMTRAVLERGRRAGLRRAALVASPEATDLYSHMGFEECCRVFAYRRPAGDAG